MERATVMLNMADCGLCLSILDRLLREGVIHDRQAVDRMFVVLGAAINGGRADLDGLPF